MKKQLKVLILLVLVLTLAGCACNKNDNKIKKGYNQNKGVIEDKKVDTLKFTDTSLKVTKDKSVLVTTVTNTSKKDKKVELFNIHIKDKNKKTIATLQGYVNGVVKVGESKRVTSEIEMNLDNAYNIEYEIVN